MTPENAHRYLEASGRVVEALVGALPAEAVHWRPGPDAWSTLEVICHLADEERDDFRARIHMTLEDPHRPWPAIDPPAWVAQHHYSARKLDDTLADYTGERSISLAWLTGEWMAGVELQAWDRPHQHYALGPLTARDVLSSWVAHDLLHIRQLARLQHQYLATTGEGRIEYAGPW